MVMKGQVSVMNALKKQQDNNGFEEAMKFLVPQLKYIALLMFKKKKNEIAELRKRIREGLEKNSLIIFNENDSSLDVDIAKLSRRQSAEWTAALKKQLKSLEETTRTF